MICFAKRGFHQTSMHDISAEAGISVGLIYRYFKNKEEVIAAIAAETQEGNRRSARTRPAGAYPARVARNPFYLALLRKFAADHLRVRGRSFRGSEPQSAGRETGA